MPTIADSIREKLLANLGVTTSSLQRIKFGRGVVGKIAIVSVSSMLAIAGTALKLSSETGQIVAIVIIGFICLATLGGILYVVTKQPEIAVLEGAELILYKQVTLGTKSQLRSSIEAPPIPEALLSPPEETTGSDTEGGA